MKTTTSTMMTFLCTTASITMFAKGFVVVHPNNKRVQQQSLTLLHGNKKDTERAHIDQQLEDMMDNDWRAFRANLVLKENAEKAKKQQQHVEVNNHRMGREVTRRPIHHNRPMAHSEQQKMSSSSFVVGADDIIGRQPIMHNEPLMEGNRNHFTSKQQTEYFHESAVSRHQQYTNHMKNPFVLDGKTPVFKKSYPRWTQGDSIQGSLPMEEFFQVNQDPFVSEGELPSLLHPLAKLDKTQWAHEIPDVELGSVLVATENLGGVFEQTIVLIVQHCEKNGSTGIVINRPMEGDLTKIYSEQKASLDPRIVKAFGSSTVTYGGPAIGEKFSILHGYGEVEGSTKICPGVYVGGSEELMDAIEEKWFNPKNALFCKGHAAWTPEQLHQQLADGAWYTAAVSSELLLRYTKEDGPSDLWGAILTSMGGKYAEIARNYGGRSDPLMP